MKIENWPLWKYVSTDALTLLLKTENRPLRRHGFILRYNLNAFLTCVHCHQKREEEISHEMWHLAWHLLTGWRKAPVAKPCRWWTQWLLNWQFSCFFLSNWNVLSQNKLRRKMKANYKDQTCLNGIKKFNIVCERFHQYSEVFRRNKSQWDMWLVNPTFQTLVSQCFESDCSVSRLCCQ